jgi:3-dehydroquinate synthase
VGHALERLSGYELPHGEAVALGLVAECELAEQLGVASAGLRNRVAALLDRLELPGRLPAGLDRSKLFAGMATDKKNRTGQIHFALARQLGEMHRENGWTTPVQAEAIGAAIAALE